MTTAAAVQDKTITLNGLRFHYLDWGNPSAQALVCLHGFTSHAHSWDTFASAMRDQYHVLALDQRGHGETEWAADYHALRRVEDMEAFVAALGLDKFVLVGLSMGGRCAFQYAARHPEKVERLVIVDIAPETSPSGSQRIAQGLANQDVFDSVDEAFAVARAGNARPPDDELRRRVEHGVLQRPDGKWTFRYDVALRNNSGARRMATPEENEQDWASLEHITSPTLLVRGVASDILSPELAQRMVQSISDCRLVEVADSGHAVPLDNPRGFLDAVRGFL
ncbi:MAG TPA: alpha/beta hydrolase [Chloroflexota bacterium]